MTGKKESGITWHHTTVVLRSDIYRQARERGIDISNACNQALADATGIDYRQQHLETVPPAAPVIIAGNGSSPKAAGGHGNVPVHNAHPVINADDPAAPVKVVQAAKKPAKKPAPDTPAVVSQTEKPAAPAAPAAKAPRKPLPQKEKRTQAGKRPRGNAIRTFFSAKIARTDDAKESVGKDELYEIFSRFCRDHRITPVPDRKAVTVALKNKFALSEELVEGTPRWTGIRLK